MEPMNEHSSATDSPQRGGDVATLLELQARRDEVLRIAAAYDARNVRVFGSVARAEADADSDVDFLVDIATDARALPILDCWKACDKHLLIPLAARWTWWTAQV
jgi:predicted nucleotidyltransferase